MKKRFHIIISGRVTGVFFRAFVKENADKLNISGWVRNLGDKVEVVFEGEDGLVDKLIDLCNRGPESAKVVDIEIKEEEYSREFDDFEIIH